jgi:hypothetical protein
MGGEILAPDGLAEQRTFGCVLVDVGEGSRSDERGKDEPPEVGSWRRPTC